MVLLLYSDSVRDITKDSRTGNAFDEGHEIECFRMKSTGLKGCAANPVGSRGRWVIQAMKF